jgi:hypothetical protein
MIIDVTNDISRYSYYKSSLNIGINYSPKDLSFSEMLIFSWIKDGLDVRAN